MKKPNIKSLFVNHFEKMLFGLFAMITVLILWQTHWSRFSTRPEALLEKIKKTKDKIVSPDNVWKERDEFKVVDYKDKVQQMFSPVSSSPYEFSTPLFHPLYKKNEPRREPTFEPVIELTAKPSLVSLSVKKAVESTPTADNRQASTTDAAEPAEALNEFSNRTDGGNRPLVPGKPGTTTAGAAPIAMPPGGLSFGRGRFGRNSDYDDDAEGNGPRRGGAPAAASTYNPNATSRGVRVVAVRGVFPLKQQIAQYARALHVTDAEAANLIEITDFILERQTAVAGPDPWKNSKWEAVNIDSATEVLDETIGVDPIDPVPVKMRDVSITMELPMRLFGYWGESATHPRLQNDDLKSEEEIEKQNQLLETLEETLDEAGVPETAKPRKRGFARAQSDIKNLAKQIKGNAKSNQLFSTKFMGGLQGNNPQNQTMAINQLADTDARYLLFRYLDFDVHSGYAYRYRVRLKLRNPNFEATDEQLAAADPNIKKGEERDTPWSNISTPVDVPRTVNYFLKNVERDPYREEKVKANTAKPVAQLAMFDWDTQLGTTIVDTLNTFSIGSFISGEPNDPKKETLVLNLAEPSDQQLQKKKHTFSSTDVLLDVEPDAEISADQHPDLKFSSEKNRGVTHLGLVEEALVFTSLGEIKILDPLTEHSKEAEWANRVKVERQGKEVSKPKSTKTTGELAEGGNRPPGRAPRRGRRPMMQRSGNRAG